MKKLAAILLAFFALYGQNSQSIQTQQTLFQEAWEQGNGSRARTLMESNKDRWLGPSTPIEEQAKKIQQLITLDKKVPKRVLAPTSLIFGHIKDSLRDTDVLTAEFIKALADKIRMTPKEQHVIPFFKLLNFTNSISQIMNPPAPLDTVQASIRNLLELLSKDPLSLLVRGLGRVLNLG